MSPLLMVRLDEFDIVDKVTSVTSIDIFWWVSVYRSLCTISTSNTSGSGRIRVMVLNKNSVVNLDP